MQNLYFYKNKPIIVLTILLTLSISLMFLNVGVKNFNVRSIFFFISYPVEYAVSAVGNFFKNTFSGFSRIRELEKELRQTKIRLIKYQEKNILYSKVMKDNSNYMQLLEIKDELDYETIYARIVFRDPTILGDYYIINKGSLDKIKNNMAVVSFDTNGNIFLVGKTVEVNISASKVKLLTAKNFYLGVSMKDTGYIGILSGEGTWNQNCLVNYVPIEANAYIGEEVITSGESDVFPWGIQVGKIVGIGKSIMEEFFQTLYVQPEYEYLRLKDVFIIRWKPNTEINTLIESSYEQ